ncbi:MAG: OadG family protein [Clostridia bacterium]|nr:OadG family protein [Clostridia bacterium]
MNVNIVEVLTSCGIGIATVFVGLVAIILICKIMGTICSAVIKDEPKAEIKKAISESAQTTDIPNKQEFIAAVSAAIAEELGTEFNGFRILSVKKL